MSLVLRINQQHSGRRPRAVVRLLLGLLCLFGVLSCPALWAQAATSTILTASPNTTLASGTLVTLSAQVSSGGVAVTGGTVLFCKATAKFCMDDAVMARAQIRSDGQALAYLRPAAGSYALKAVYQGTHSYAASSSSELDLTVTGSKKTPTVNLTASNTELGYNLTANLAATGPAAPSGNLNFVDMTTATTVSSTSLAQGATALSVSTPVSYATGAQQYGPPAENVAHGDFNQDGYMDVVVADSNSARISVLLNKGDGTFNIATSYTTTGNPYAVAVADINNDGLPDIIVTEYGVSGNVGVFLNNGNGVFASQVLYAAGAYTYGLAIGDVNGDGLLDIVVSDGGSAKTTGNLHVLLNQGNGIFGTAADYDSGAWWPRSVRLADMNGDGVLDLMATNYGMGSASTASLLIGNGDGSFGTPSQYALSISSSYPGVYSGEVADLNGDGLPDYVSANYGDLTVGVLLNQGNGSLAPVVRYATSTSAYKLAAVDVDGDGVLDLVGSSMLGFQILRGKGDGSFSAATSYSGGFFNSAVDMTDINNDGVPDLLTSSYYMSSLYVVDLTRSYTATATLNDYAPQGNGLHQFDAEYDGDNNYSAAHSSAVSLNASLIVTTTTLSANPASGAQAGMPVVLTATVAPASSGSLTASGTVSFSEGTKTLGTATLSGGQAQLSVSSLALGDHSITATYSGDTNFRGSVAAAIPVSIAADVVTPTMVVSPSLAVNAGAAVTLTTTATYGPNAVVGGVVNYCLSGYKLCQGAALVAQAAIPSYGSNTGKAVAVVRLPAGSYSIYAQYVGTSSYASSTVNTAAQTLVVSNATAAATTLSLSSSGTAGNYTLTGTLASSDHAQPTGTIDLLDTSNNQSALASAALSEATVTTQTQFNSAAAVSGATTPQSVLYADINNDGVVDMLVSSAGDGTARIYLGQGDGSFTATGSVSAGTGASVMVAGDFDANGKTDLAVSATSGTTKIYSGNGDGSFSSLWTISQAASALALADLNHDSFPELVLTSGTTMYVYAGNSYGQYMTATNYTLGNTATAVATGDFNGDGYPDLAVLESGTPGTVNLYLTAADNSGALSTPVSYTVGNTPVSIVSGDFDGDGVLDLAVLNQGDQTVQLLSGAGDGSFTSKASYTVTGSTPYAIAGGDFNGDGKLDLSVADAGTSAITLLINDGAGNLGTTASYATGTTALSGLAVADLNNDGIADATVASTTANTATVLLGAINRTQTITLSGVAQPGSGTHAVEASYAGDTNHASALSSTVALDASLVPTSLNFQVSATQTQYGQPVTVQASLSPATLDGYVPSGQVSFTDNAALLGNTTLGSAASASTTVATLAVGQHLLSASYAGDSYFKPSTTASSSVQVTTATTTTTASPVTSTYGTAASTTINVAGAYAGSGLTLPTGALSLTLDGSPAGSATVSGGTATASLPTTTGAGTHTLAVGYAGDGNYSASATSTTVTVARATPSLQWATPAAIAYGTALDATQLNASATGVNGAALDGTFTYTPAAGTVPNAGTQTLTVRFDPTDSTNYVSTTATVTLEVDRKAVTVNWAAPAAIAYGTALSSEQLNATASVDGSFSYTPAVGRVLGVGTQNLTVIFTPADAVNYSAQTKQVTLTVTPAALSVVANAASRSYGAANPTFSGTINGLIGADSLTATYTTTATASSPAGTYAIVPSVNGAAAGNYTVAASNGVLTVTKAATTTALTLPTSTTQAGASFTLVASVKPATSGTPTGMVSFYDNTTLLGTATLSSAGTASYNANALSGGTHSLTASYAGDGNFTSSSSASASATVQDFGFSTGSGSSSGTSTSAAPTLTISSGGTASYSFSIVPLNGSFTNAVTFSVDGLPSTMTGTFSPSSLEPGTTAANVTLTITSNKAQAMSHLHGTTALALGLLLLPLAGLRRAGRRLQGMALILLIGLASLGAAVSLSGCGGTSKPTNYTVTITATSGAASHSTTLTLAVH